MTEPSTTPRPVPRAVRTWLSNTRRSDARVDQLTGDASDRQYFRITPTTDRSSILAVYAAPFEAGAQPFIQVTALFQQMAVPVPAVLGHDGDLGVIELEDLGDESLQARLAAATAADRRRLYESAVDLIIRIQDEGERATDRQAPPFGLAFNTEKLAWELEFFLTHYVEGHRAARLTPAARDALCAEFRALAGRLAAEPRVLCHRDFHSRNLMVRHDALVVIDHQDARMGPDTYDLVSLLRDAYVAVTEDEIDALTRRFLACRPAVDPEAFRTRFDTMALQRCLKALGTFGFQATKRDNPAYLVYTPGPLAAARRVLEAQPGFSGLREILATAVPEVG